MSLLSAAVHNNAKWCDAVCRALACETAWLDGLWVNRSPAPPYYPNAVTLEPIDSAPQEAHVRAMLTWELPRSWTIKDSYSRLALAPLGFGILFEAEWIGLAAGQQPRERAADDLAWVAVTRDVDLMAWEGAWRSADSDTATASIARLFQPALLDDPNDRFLAGMREGRIEAVAVANRSDDGSGPVVGVSNIMFSGGDLRRNGAGLIAAVQDVFPGLPLVGYHGGDDLTALLALGFRSLGSLRVWLRT